LQSLRLNRWVYPLLCALPLIGSGLAYAGDIRISCQREEVFCADVSPLHVAHLSERLVIASSDTVFVDGEALGRGDAYWVDYGQGIVYLRDGIKPGQCVRVTYSVFPLKLKPSYSLRTIDPARRAHIPAQGSGLVIEKTEHDYDLKASGFKTISLETGTLKDVRISQSLSLTLGGKIGDAVDIKGVLSDGDASFGQMTSTTRLKDLDRIFMEVRSAKAFARVGDIEIDQAPGELLKFRRNMTGFFTHASHGSKGFMASGAASRSKYESAEIAGREGITGPYAVLEPDGQRASIVKNSDRVWVDGRPMTRGGNADYTIDYALGEIYFSPRHMIREGARIVIDYESLRHEDRRQFYFGRSNVDIGDRTSVAVSVVNEGYSPAPSSSLLDGEEPNAILSAGGGEWTDGGNYVGVGKGSYMLVEVDSLRYYEYMGEGLGDYDVKFTRVAEDEGTYAYTYSETWDRYIYLYTGHGEYIDKVRASPKLSSRVIHVSASAKPVDWLEVTSEAAQSKGHCKDPQGVWDLKEDRAYTVALHGSSELPELAGRSIGAIDIRAKRRSVGDSYIGFDRLRRPDFLEVWAQDPEGVFEKSNELGLDYTIGQKLKTTLELGSLHTGAGKSQRYSAGVDLGDERLGFTASSEIARMASQARPRASERNLVGIRIPLSFIRLGFGRNFEMKSRLRDSISVRRTEYYSTVSMSGRYGRMGVTLSRRSEDSDQGDGWGDYASVLEWRVEFESNMGKAFSVRGAFSQRAIDYAPAVSLSDQRSTGADLHMNLRDLLAVSSLSLDYRLANTLTTVYGAKLVEAAYGGDYDSLGNYVPGSGGYVLSRYEMGKEPVTKVRANVAVELGRKGKIILDRSLSARTGIDVEGESSADRVEQVALLKPAYLFSGPDMRFGRFNVVQEIVYRSSQTLTMSVTARGLHTVDARCADRSESRTTGELLAKVLSSGFRGMSIGLEGRVADTRSVIEMAAGNISPDQRSWSARFNVQRNIRSNLRGKIGLEFLGQDRTQPTSSSLEAKLSPSFTFFAGPLRWDGGLGLRRIVRSASSVPVMSPRRDSVDWDSRLNMRQGKYTSLSLQYSGHKARGLDTVHNLRASLTATF
jgi:hypothetical protein